MDFGTNIEGRAIKTKPKSVLLKNRPNETIFRGIDEKNVGKKITAKVNLKMKANEKDLSAKRKRLRILLEQEEQMYKEFCKIEMNKKLPKIIKEKSVEDNSGPTRDEEEFLAHKILQLEISKCEEIKPLIAQRRDTETRKIQEMQIKEKNAFKQQENDKEKIWHNMMIKDTEIRKTLEDNEKEKQHRDAMAIQNFLEIQIKLKKELSRKQNVVEKEGEQKDSIENNKKLNDIILHEKLKQKEKKAALNVKLIDQINTKKKTAERDKKNIIDLERSFISSSLKKYEEDLQKKLREKKHNQKEINLFNEYMSKIQSLRKAQSKNDENFVEDISSKLLENEDYYRDLFKQKRKQLLQNALCGRDTQIEEKKKKDELKKVLMKKEICKRIEIQNKIAEETKQEKDHILKTKIAYKNDLEEQIKANKIFKENELIRLKAEADEKLIQEQKATNKCMELMKREFNSENTHPFTKIMKNSQASKDTWYSFIPETKYTKY